MKRILLLITILSTALLFAQIPQGISYQAIALNGSGNPVVSSNVGLRLSILNGTATGTTVYSETHLKTTTAQGLFNLIIGQGIVGSGNFAGINWATGSKFLKVEMDISGGTNYILVGTTQLLSVPYALTAGNLVLTSPNGTPYQVSVNDSGQLSLPSTGTSTNYPDNLYLYGTFNSFTPSSALLMLNSNNYYVGYKYLTAGSQVKFLAGNTANSTVYGVNSSANLVVNAAAQNITSNNFYYIEVGQFDPDLALFVTPISPDLYLTDNSSFGNTITTTGYNVATNTFTYNVTGVVAGYQFGFNFQNPSGGGSGSTHGDFLNDGTIDYNAPLISFPGANATPKNYRITLVINFNGSGTYTVTQI